MELKHMIGLFWFLIGYFFFAFSLLTFSQTDHALVIPELHVAIDSEHYRLCVQLLIVFFAMIFPYVYVGNEKHPVVLISYICLPVALSIWFETAMFHFRIAVGFIIFHVLIILVVFCCEKKWEQRSSDQAPGKNKKAMIKFMLSCSLVIFVCSMMILDFVTYAQDVPDSSQQNVADSLDEFSTNDREKDTAMMDDNSDTLSALNSTRWSLLSPSDKLLVLRTVADIEFEYLGIEPIPVEGDIFEESELNAKYRNDKQTKRKWISVSFPYLEECSSDEALRTICHEIRHYFQSITVELIDWDDSRVKENRYFEEALNWKNNFENYNDELSDDYFFQTIETDARAYAKGRAEEYLIYAKNLTTD